MEKTYRLGLEEAKQIIIQLMIGIESSAAPEEILNDILYAINRKIANHTVTAKEILI